MIIRPEQPEDYKAVFQLNSLAFQQDGEARLVEALRLNSEVFVPELSLVALIDDKIVGHILFTKIKIIDGAQQTACLALAPVAVSPDFQKQGIGSQLIKHGLLKAKALGYTAVIVLGHEHYYPKFGFLPASKYGIKCPFEVPDEVFMALELVEGGLKGVHGTVKYPKEFEAV